VADPVFILATDLRPDDPAWARAEDQAAALQSFAARALGVAPRVVLGWFAQEPAEVAGEHHLRRVLETAAADAAVLFVLPCAFELSLYQRTLLGEELSDARRRSPEIAIHHDAVEPAHPLLVECFCDQILQALALRRVPPQQAGVLLVADGQGDPATRADSYRLMRLLWEHGGLARGEVGFVGRAQPFLPQALKRCLADPLEWLLVPQSQWDCRFRAYAQVMLEDHQRAHPQAAGWRLLDPPCDHPAIQAWLEQRLVRLWQEKRARDALRVRSARYEEASTPAGIWTGTSWQPPAEASVRPTAGIVARTSQVESLAEILARVLPPSEWYLVKVTWHGYAQGTYTSAAALDLLLGALPGRAVLVEGHTSSRNRGGLAIEWEREADQHRGWIRQQDLVFLQRTGVAQVIAKHKAQYVNVTEAWWDAACAPLAEVQAALGTVELQNPELAGFVPAAIMELRGTPMISFARFKGPTRLGISNLFGLIPHPLRTAWHGAAITDFAAVCCDLAKVYQSIFPLFGLVEAFDSAVRWDRKGLYRSRWGNYDLVLTDGLFTLSEGLTGADILASRLQGQDVARSGFFDVVRQSLGWSADAANLPLPGDLQALLA